MTFQTDLEGGGSATRFKTNPSDGLPHGECELFTNLFYKVAGVL